MQFFDHAIRPRAQIVVLRVTIEPFCENVHSILDFHEEIPLGKFSKNRTGKPKLFWEGLPATIDGLKPISEVFSNVFRSEWELNIVTDLTYFRLLNKYFEGDTQSKLNGYFKEDLKNKEVLDDVCKFILNKKSIDDTVIAKRLESLKEFESPLEWSHDSIS